MALEKLFEQIIDQHIHLNMQEEIITDVEDKCTRVHTIYDREIGYYGRRDRGNSHCNSHLNPKILHANIDRFPNLKEFVITDVASSIDLSKLPKSLEAFSILGKRNLTPLNDLPNLRNLGFMCVAADLEQIPALFEKLHLLSFISAKDEAQLANFVNLDTLTFGTLRESCAPIGELKKLRRLQIETFKPDTFAGLEGCEALTNLRIQNEGELSEISALASLKNLKQFTALGMHAVTDLSPLAGLPLEVLDIPNCGATDFSPLAGLKNLKKLNLRGCLIDDLSVLEGLENLEEIDLYGVIGILMEDKHFFDPLVKLPNLKNVNVDGWPQNVFPPALLEKLGLRP